MTAGESGIFSTVRAGVEAGGRPVGSDGLQTFGGIRALARYVKIGVIPPSGGGIVINEASVGQHLGQLKSIHMFSTIGICMTLVYSPPIRSGGSFQSRRIFEAESIGQIVPFLLRPRLICIVCSACCSFKKSCSSSQSTPIPRTSKPVHHTPQVFDEVPTLKRSVL